jgi:arsenate reductase (thioredoxin)
MAPGLIMKPKILVLCTGNSCRSQMAEGYLRKFAGNRAEVFSAGVMPHGVNPNAIAVMKEDGIDISGQTSNHVDAYRHIRFDYVITVCDNAREQCPVFPAAAKQLHRDFPDPAAARGTQQKIMDEFRSVRDMIREYCTDFVTNYISG